jgi:hypothetical protein
MLDIHGWIEATVFRGEEQEDEHAWGGVIRLGPLVDVPDAMSERLFGLSKRYVGGEADDLRPLAARRGLPAYPSAEVLADAARIAEHEKTDGPGEVGGYTHATWRELKTASISADELGDSDWALVFALLSTLESDHRFEDDRLRLVVWYCW